MKLLTVSIADLFVQVLVHYKLRLNDEYEFHGNSVPVDKFIKAIDDSDVDDFKHWLLTKKPGATPVALALIEQHGKSVDAVPKETWIVIQDTMREFISKWDVRLERKPV